MLTTIQKPEVRKATYGVVAAVMTLLMVLGIVKADDAARYLDSISQVAGVVFLPGRPLFRALARGQGGRGDSGRRAGAPDCGQPHSLRRRRRSREGVIY